mmetsp:Transcript_22405/g.31160  ORF Transcript_22405/g.31160 Transcript_22405/m.31160 type:complete len:135 (-) Transcript_22405:167-571(-)
MPNYSIRISFFKIVLLLFLLACCLEFTAGKKNNNKKRQQSGSRNQDREYRLKRLECEPIADSKSECTGSPILKENCVLKCISDDCYSETYGTDPLEEGEIDTVRGKSFRTCMKKEVKEKERIEREEATKSNQLE